MKRLVSLLVLAAFVGALTGIVLADEPLMWTGTVVKVADKDLTIKAKDGDKDIEKTVATDDKTMVSLDGKDAKLADLKPDMKVVVTMNADKTAAAKVVATSITMPKL